MAAQIGIELSPGYCRIVEAEVRPNRGGATRVRRFSVLPAGSRELASALGALRGRSAAVVVWGAPSDHRQVMVTAGTYESMRREARRSLALAGVETRGAMVDIARAPYPFAAGPRRPVVVALANGAAVRAAVEPLRAAGIAIKTLGTPATAIVSLARTRRQQVEGAARSPSIVEGGSEVQVDAFIVIEESATCIALLRDGALVAARELSWGFLEGRRAEPRHADDIARRASDELDEFLVAVGGSIRSVRRATLCGGAPGLRTIAAALTVQLGADVEALDALPGAESTLSVTLEQCADMWLAWAVAADPRAPLSLVHANRRREMQARVAQVAVAAGLVAGLAIGYEAARSVLVGAEPARAPQLVSPRPPGSSGPLIAKGP